MLLLLLRKYWKTVFDWPPGPNKTDERSTNQNVLLALAFDLVSFCADKKVPTAFGTLSIIGELNNMSINMFSGNHLIFLEKVNICTQWGRGTGPGYPTVELGHYIAEAGERFETCVTGGGGSSYTKPSAPPGGLRILLIIFPKMYFT